MPEFEADEISGVTKTGEPESYDKSSAGINGRDHEVLARWWQSVIGKGLKYKNDFTKHLNEAERFCYESHDFLWDEIDPDAQFKSTIPKVWEMVNIFGPMLAFRNPNRTARVRNERPTVTDPQTGQEQSDPRVAYVKVLQQLLNYGPGELGLVDESREWVDQAIVAGAGVVWLEKDPQSDLLGWFHDDIRNLVIDPDAHVLRDALWCARRRMMPRWKFADMADIELDDRRLPRGNHPEIIVDETDEQSSPGRPVELDHVRGKTNESIEVWEVWSKMGLGFRGRNIDPDVAELAKPKEEKWGDFCHFYVVPGSPRLWLAKDDWDLPLYADTEWPFEMLFFRKKRNYLWPVSILKAVLGQQKALDWIATMVLNKIRTTSRDFIVTLKQLDGKVRDQIENGFDLSILKLDGLDLAEGRRVQDLISFLQAPTMNKDIWATFELYNTEFEKSSGLYAALYGTPGPGGQDRSATATEAKQNRADLRPDDMRERVERCHTKMARKEAIGIRLTYDARKVAKILGIPAAKMWGQYQRGDLETVLREIDFTIEAESTAKRNLQKEREDTQVMFDRLIQLALGFQDLKSINKLVWNLQRAFNVPEADRIQIQPPPPPPEEQKPREADTADADEAVAQEKAGEAAAKREKAQAEAVKAKVVAMIEAMKARGEAPPDLSQILESGLPIGVQNGAPVHVPDGVPAGM